MSQIVGMATIAHEHAVIVLVICIHFFLHVICLYRNERSIEKAAAWQHQIRVFYFVIACVIPHIVWNSVTDRPTVRGHHDEGIADDDV